MDPLMTRRNFVAKGVTLGVGLLAPSVLLSAENLDSKPQNETVPAPNERLDGKSSDELAFASAIEAGRAIRNRSISSTELTKLMLQRIEKYNPKINAVVTLQAEEALKRAKAADEALARGESWGAFHGVPCTFKDVFETAGLRTTAGAPFLANYIPQQDAVVVARLRAAGAVILGKTNTPMMAADGQTFNPVFGVTNNPYDLKRTPGGSSGGSCAALAAGLTFLCVGSDKYGSIRAPAHFCGVYGHKPSVNVVPERGHIPPPPGGPPRLPSDISAVGPLARSANDLHAALAVLGGPDRDEAIAYRWSLPPARRSQLSEFRIGYVVDDKLCPVTAEVKEVLAAMIKALEKTGTKLQEGWPAGINPAGQYDVFYHLNRASEAMLMKDGEEETLRQLAAKQDGSYAAKQARAWTAPHKQFLIMNSARVQVRATWQEYFRAFDVFLMPAVFCAAPPLDQTPWDSRFIPTPEGKRSYYDLYPWISFAGLAGLPATVAPVGQTKDGLPVGIQIVGPYLEDATPIALAQHLSEVVGGFKPPTGFRA